MGKCPEPNISPLGKKRKAGKRMKRRAVLLNTLLYSLGLFRESNNNLRVFLRFSFPILNFHLLFIKGHNQWPDIVPDLFLGVDAGGLNIVP
jgi:hypothetical protein